MSFIEDKILYEGLTSMNDIGEDINFVAQITKNSLLLKHPHLLRHVNN